MEFKTRKTWREDIELFDDYFSVNKERIEYKDVLKLWYDYELYRKGVSAVHDFAFRIYLKSGEKIYQGTKYRREFLNVFTLGMASEKPAEELQHLFALLSQRTYKHRIYKYEQIYNKYKYWYLGDEFGYQLYVQDYYSKENERILKFLRTREKGGKSKIVGLLNGRMQGRPDLALEHTYDHAILSFRKVDISKMDKFKNEFRKSKVDEYSISLNTDPDIRRFIIEEKIGISLKLEETFINKLLYGNFDKD